LIASCSLAVCLSVMVYPSTVCCFRRDEPTDRNPWRLVGGEGDPRLASRPMVIHFFPCPYSSTPIPHPHALSRVCRTRGGEGRQERRLMSQRMTHLSTIESSRFASPRICAASCGS